MTPLAGLGLLLDNSAWTRLATGHVPGGRVRELETAADEGRLVVCAPFALEALYSARSARDYEQISAELEAFRWAALSDNAARSALISQSQLARVGHHRIPPVDLLIAAIADEHDLAILHHDHDYDTIAGRTDLRFASVWITPPPP